MRTPASQFAVLVFWLAQAACSRAAYTFSARVNVPYASHATTQVLERNGYEVHTPSGRTLYVPRTPRTSFETDWRITRKSCTYGSQGTGDAAYRILASVVQHGERTEVTLWTDELCCPLGEPDRAAREIAGIEDELERGVAEALGVVGQMRERCTPSNGVFRSEVRRLGQAAEQEME